MDIAPIVVPARDEAVYPLLRVASIGIAQSSPGGPVSVSYQIEHYRLTDAGAEAAPPGTSAGGSLVLGVDAIRADPRLAAAVESITAVAVEQAVRAGLLRVLASK